MSQIPSNFGAAGLIIGLPFLNGGLYKSRQAEAVLRTRSLGRRVADLENRVAGDVVVAWLDVPPGQRFRLELRQRQRLFSG
ncbi:MAG: hypothetical protein SGI92_29500 [Bryobacteraceae bacterium]|nr:hypothetical protein [Bryobacteraceae bacterium]